jgi:Putative MetA-pathway of phenol degradation
MKKYTLLSVLKIKGIILCAFLPVLLQAQTLNDGIYMPKNNFCGGFLLMQDKFENYWEGTTQRNNLNMGTMTMKGIGAMANYGISDNLNIIASLPYFKTQASGGVMAGMSGFQDLTVALKYKALKMNDLSANIIIGGTMPVTNYVAAYPLAIGNQSKTAFGRAMLHYLNPKGFTATAQGTYMLRSNIKIDASNYYTDKNIFSNEVAIADVANFSFRTGYYTHRIAGEAYIEQTKTLGGFDIRRNDMMFPAANKMIATRVGFTGFYRIKPLHDLQVVANVAYTLSGRNVGQATSAALGFMMAFDWRKKENTDSK